jgi:hypothetical protein
MDVNIKEILVFDTTLEELKNLPLLKIKTNGLGETNWMRKELVPRLMEEYVKKLERDDCITINGKFLEKFNSWNNFDLDNELKIINENN